MPVTWNASFNTSPPATDPVHEGDDRIRDTREGTRERGNVVQNWDSYSAGGYSGDGRMNPGTARAYFQDADPTALQRPNGTNHPSLPTGGSASLGASDDGLIKVVTGNGQYQPYVWDNSIPGFALMNNIDPATMVDEVESSFSTSVSGTTPVIMQDSAGTADLVASVTVPSVGLWMVVAEASFEVFKPTAGTIGNMLTAIRVTATPGATTNYWRSYWQHNSPNALAHFGRESVSLFKRIAPAVAGTTYDIRVAGIEDGVAAVEFGGLPAVVGGNDMDAVISAIVLPFGA